MSRPDRSKVELIEASEHLFYEFSMFMGLARLQATGAFGESLVNNALLESFTIHARVLLYFLYSENPRPDDVIAEDFLDDTDVWHSTRPNKSSKLNSVHQRVGKEVAHLTYARHDVTPETKKWYFIDIANEVEEIFKQFINLVPPELLCDYWKS